MNKHMYVIRMEITITPVYLCVPEAQSRSAAKQQAQELGDLMGCQEMQLFSLGPHGEDKPQLVAERVRLGRKWSWHDVH